MEMAQEQELILVLDFGSQYNQLITRRIREMGVYSELHDHEISVDEIKRMNPKGIILSGGPNSVYEEGSFTIDPEIYNLGIPVLGICYGMQLTTKLLGGKLSALMNVSMVKQLLMQNQMSYSLDYQLNKLYG